jgi:hypothetical protein
VHNYLVTILKAFYEQQSDVSEEEDLIAIIQTTVFSLKFASLKDPIIEPTGLTGLGEQRKSRKK